MNLDPISKQALSERAGALVPPLLGGLALGVAGDALLRAPGPFGLNMSLWVALVALAAFVLYRRSGLEPDRERVAWLAIAVLFAAALAWRDSPPLKLLALGSATVGLALAAYRADAAWVRSAGVVRYVRAWGTGALHAWTAAVPALLDAGRSTSTDGGRGSGWRRVVGVVRGLVIAAPLVLVFGALLMSADAVFAELVLNVVRVDFDRIASHLVLFAVSGWLATGYLVGFLRGTELPPLGALWRGGAVLDRVPTRPPLGITEVTTVLTALNLLFLLFVIVQFRYLFGGDALVRVTPELTYAEYARRGFFELVFAVALVVPVLLAADWLLAGRRRGEHLVFRVLAGVQVALVLTITVSALFRLRLYHASYGLTDARFYAAVLLIWMGVMLLWLAATVLRGRRDAFAFGALVSGLSIVALLLALNPDAVVARTNVARINSPDAPAPFDVSYAMSLSGDAAPILIEALPALPPEARCRLARHLLRRWPPDRELSIRSWSWAASRASDAVREHEARLRAMAGSGQECVVPGEASEPGTTGR